MDDQFIETSMQEKNLLYRQFLKRRSTASEEKYKIYKNKLTGILRHCEKQHYTELFEKNKGNIKEKWKIINGLINKKTKGTTYPTELRSNGNTITGNKNIANCFNHFFVNIGPSLANKIPRSNNVLTRYLSDKVNDTLFLKPVTKEQIINLVKNIKSKKS